MKRIIKKLNVVVMCVLASAFYCSCTNEEGTSKPNAKTVALRGIQEFSYNNNGNIVNMLSFNSIDDFIATVDRLKADDEEYNERFYSQLRKILKEIPCLLL